MSKLEWVLCELDMIESGRDTSLSTDIRAQIIVTLLFLISVLSLPILDIQSLILFSIYPIIGCSIFGLSYSKIFKRSMIVLPFVLFIGMFNPIFDTRTIFTIGTFEVTAGWVSFISIIIRGLLSVQAAMMLIYRSGFYSICHSLQHVGVPSLFANQLMFAYHYIYILTDEALSMQRARASRGYGNKNYSFRMWGTIVGQLLLRTMDRASRIHNAMLSRGFTGHIGRGEVMKWQTKDTIFIIVWGCAFAFMRFINPLYIFSI